MVEKQRNIFEQSGEAFRKKHAPLAHRMCPRVLEDFVGQEKLLQPGKILYNMIVEDTIVSMILWGPPGTGKTSLARIIAQQTGSKFVFFSAVISGIKEVKEVITQAKHDLGYYNHRTIMFIDEIHRFNKAQQDAFLPHIENGTILFIGATTENPSFEVNTPLLSRLKVFILEPLTIDHLKRICERALADSERGLASFKAVAPQEIITDICFLADGDARIALNTLELAVISTKANEQGQRLITREKIFDIVQKRVLLYDKSSEEHFNLISAFHKALRGSDPDGSIYWLTRMLDAGEDPLFIARRLIRSASEDVGLADPNALQVCIAARDAYRFLGLPEGALALFQAAIYVATAPKSNALYQAQKAVTEEIKQTGSLPVPLHIRNAPTDLMKDVGYGKGYQYAHDFPEAIETQDYLPAQLLGRTYYHPKEAGYEKLIKERIDYWLKKRVELRQKNEEA
ncbi:replication-associated recombination protein A [candidate division CSSED10-310 bacterium]|uniref:Replication-associated recombination protein A n=1 Tax=candidate division CSSED10-310 bacterium TaxID=2855610 RepID=A0ABV6YZB1_UNCC1